MGTTTKPALRWILIAGYLGIITSMLACAALTVATPNAEAGTIQITDGVVEMVNEDGDSIPVAGDSTFELVGELESMDPWTVAGKTFETNEATQIEEDLQVGDLVRVRGTILEDGTWVAYSIELAEEQIDPIIILIGIVDSIDPWVVNGIELNVTDQTDIQGDITVGMLVRVEILLSSDGTWEVLSIAPLGDVTDEEGCVTIIATIISVDGDEVQFLGWFASITLGEDVQIEGGDGTLSPDQVVIVVLCTSEDGQVVIVQIIILDGQDEDGATPTPDPDGEGESGEKVLVCHKPNKNAKTLSLPQSAVPAHLGHGDKLGACP